jgi:hypothetical protein
MRGYGTYLQGGWEAAAGMFRDEPLTPEQKKLLHKYVSADRNPEKQLDFSDYSRKLCSAGRNYINLMPNGDVYTCSSGISYHLQDLARRIALDRPIKQFVLGNLFDGSFALNNNDVFCSLPCKDACDIDSVKIRRF